MKNTNKTSRLFWHLGIVILLAVTCVSCTKRQKEARILKRADKYFAEGNYDAAEIEYLNAIRVNHFSSYSFGRMGTIYLEQGKLSRAYPFLLRGYQIDTNNLDSRVKLGQLFLAASKTGDARKLAVYVLLRRPDDPDAPVLLADSSGTLADIDDAKHRLENLDVAPDKQAPLDLALGTLAFRVRDFKTAMAMFDRARTVDPTYGAAYGATANLYLALKDPADADEMFKLSLANSPMRASRRLRYVQFKIQNGDVTGAKIILQEMVDKAPDYLPAAVTLAEIDAGEKNYEEANALLAKVLARDNENYDALFLSGRVALLQNDPASSVTQFDRMSKLYPRAQAVLYQLALAYRAQGDIANAIGTLDRLLGLNPKFSEALLVLGQLKLAKGEDSSAIASLKNLVEINPKMLEGQLLLGDAYRQQGDILAAADIYKQMESQFPTNAEPPLLLGMSYLDQGKKEQARKEFQKSLQISPKFLEALEQLADLEVNEGNFSAAFDDVHKVINLDPQLPDPYLLIAKIDMAQKDSKSATDTLLKTIDAHPDFSAGYMMLARIYDETKQQKTALDILHQLLVKFPQNEGALMLLGNLQERYKDFDGAMETYEKVLVVNSKNSIALNNLACIYADRKQLDKGYDLAQRARTLLPFDASAADTLGWILFKKGDYSQAETLLRESALTLARSPDVQLHLGMAHYMLGDEAAARASLQFALQSGNLYSDKDEAAASLSVLGIDPQTAGPDTQTTLEKRVAEHPDDPVAQNRLGAIYKREGNMDKAVTAYEASLKTDPKNFNSLADLAQIYATRPEQKARAYDLAKSAYKLQPDDFGNTRLLGHLAFQQGDPAWSINLLQDCLRTQPDNPELNFDLAQASYIVGATDDAQARIRTALKAGASFTNAPAAQRFLDLIALSTNPAQAVAGASQVEQALKADPENIPALMASGIIDEQKSDLTAAQAVYEKILGHYPLFTPAQKHLAIIYSQSPADEKNAMAVALKAHDAFPDDNSVSKALAIICYRQGDYGRSSRLLTELAKSSPDDGQVAYYLGMDQYQARNRVESKKNLTRALTMKLSDKQTAEAKRVLGEIK